MNKKFKALSGLLVLVLIAPQLVSGAVSFEREVLPLLERRCNRCHHPDESQSGLDLTRLSTILRGGDSLGPAVVPGKPDASPLIRVLAADAESRMPLESDPLPRAEVELLRRWISEGAKDDRPQFASQDVAFFEKHIRPLLFDRCFKCHAGADPASGLQLSSRFGILMGGERGPAAVSGKPEESRLLKAIQHEGELKMPLRGDRLGEEQVASIAEWIRRGLPWPREQLVLTRAKRFTVSEADRKHWAFRSLPQSPPSEWSIDTVLDRHQRRTGIQPSASANRFQLLRRVSYDLIGYPPSRSEISDFVHDELPRAFEKVVDRLLNDSRFGWRWGRHWLDYTRNGANGQPNRGPALDSTRYAAWVAQCLNDDRPYDWFARMHIAGDLLPAWGEDERSYSIDQALAAAVPLNGPRTFQEAATETFVLMDKLDEGVEFMGRSLMGVSLECARCHDHKFDPISQSDYYALLGFFQSSWFAPVPVTARKQIAASKAVEEFRELVRERARLSGFIRKQGTRLNVGGGGRVKAWRATRPEILAPKDRRLRELEILVLRAELEQAIDDNESSLANDLRTTLAEREKKLGQHKPPEYDVRTLKELGYFIKGHKSQIGLIPRAEQVAWAEVVHELREQAAYWEAERGRWGERARFGGFARTDPEVAELAAADERIKQISETLPMNPLQPWNTLGETHLIVRAEGGFRRAEDLADLDARAQAAGLQFNRNNPDRVLLHAPFIGDSRLLERGDVLHPANLVERTTPGFFGTACEPVTGSGRRQLAEWLTKSDSVQAALVARAAVNRVWQHLFAEALCRTPNELGRLGAIPEMPELLDGLAASFVHHGWSVKAMVREIVLSQAYQRTSACSDECFEADPTNLWFARQNVRRLEAEAVLNTVAWLRTGQRFNTPNERDANVPEHATFLREFDGPTTDDIIHRRVASVTPTQALFLMNNSAIALVVDALAKTTHRDSETELVAVAERLYLEILQRPPLPRDLELIRKFQQERRQQTGNANPAAELRQLIHLLLCSNELVHVE